MYKNYTTILRRWYMVFYRSSIKCIDRLGTGVLKRKLIMRINLVSFFVLLSFVHVFATSHAQNVSYKASTTSAERLFSEIRKQTGYSVFYSGLKLKGVQLSNLNFQRTPLKDVLDQLSHTQGWNYEIADKTIILRQNITTFSSETNIGIKVDELQQQVVSGVVSNKRGEILPGVTIIEKGGECNSHK